MRQGTKKLHSRPWTTRAAAIQPGDIVVFVKSAKAAKDTFQALVTSVTKFASIDALLEEVDVATLYPGIDSAKRARSKYLEAYPSAAAKPAVVIGLSLSQSVGTPRRSSSSEALRSPTPTEIEGCRVFTLKAHSASAKLRSVHIHG